MKNRRPLKKIKIYKIFYPKKVNFPGVKIINMFHIPLKLVQTCLEKPGDAFRYPQHIIWTPRSEGTQQIKKCQNEHSSDILKRNPVQSFEKCKKLKSGLKNCSRDTFWILPKATFGLVSSKAFVSNGHRMVGNQFKNILAMKNIAQSQGYTSVKKKSGP